MIIFRNKGLIDLDAATVMGASIKDSDSAIGYFGTGFKFAIATILRNGGSVVLWRGDDRHVFEARSSQIRGEDFDLVYMDDQKLGYTTQLGRNWEPWMAFRELASNARDEGGEYLHSRSGENAICSKHFAGSTTILVEGLDEIWDQRHSILLESAAIHELGSVDIHRGQSNWLFYRGVRIHQLNKPSFFTYNIQSKIDLTEDRTAKSSWQCGLAIERAIGQLEDADILRQILTCGDAYWEHDLNVPTYGNPGEAFGAVARQISLGAETTKANPAAQKFARESKIRDMKEGDGMQLSELQDGMLQKAIRLLEAGGFDISAFPIICCDTLGPNIHGLAKDGKIFLAAAAFDKGTRELAATIFEEWAHLRSGSGDFTRDFQNWLIDRILIMTEQNAGEAF